MPVFGYPTLVIACVAAYLRSSPESRGFVVGAFFLGLAGMSGALDGVVYWTGSAGASVAHFTQWVVGAVA